MNRGGSRTAAATKMERFVIIVNGWKPLTIITKSSILDIAAVLDPPLMKGKITDSLRSPLTKKPTEVGYRKLNEVPGNG